MIKKFFPRISRSSARGHYPQPSFSTFQRPSTHVFIGIWSISVKLRSYPPFDLRTRGSRPLWPLRRLATTSGHLLASPGRVCNGSGSCQCPSPSTSYSSSLAQPSGNGLWGPSHRCWKFLESLDCCRASPGTDLRRRCLRLCCLRLGHDHCWSSSFDNFRPSSLRMLVLYSNDWFCFIFPKIGLWLF